ncbi:hypothetical protein E4U50_007576 [Claviceps purpurea]|nr:hypothetical protein E4U50_007576 [Claviceps purpurea]
MDMFQVTGVTDQKTVANFVFGLVNTEKEVGYSILCEHLEQLRRQLDILAPMVDGSGHIAVEIRVFDILDIINAISVWFSPSVVDVWADVSIDVVHAELLPTIRKDATKDVLQSPLLSVMTTIGVLYRNEWNNSFDSLDEVMKAIQTGQRVATGNGEIPWSCELHQSRWL